MAKGVSLRVLLLLGAAGVPFSAAIAQAGGEGARPAPAAQAAKDSETDIVVTARRRAESVQDVPIAVTAFGPEALEKQNITSIETLNGRVPGLTVAPVSGSGRTAPIFSMRGQSQQEVGAIADPSVSLYVNDVPVPRAQGANLGFFDLASVEVLKGPQGTLFGRNTPGGAILIRPQLPKDHFEASVSQAIGNYNAFTTEAMINLPLADGFSLRLAGQRVRRDGWIIDDVTGNDVNFVKEDAIRAGLRIAPADSGIESTTLFAYSHADDGGAGSFLSFTLNPLLSPLLPGLRDRPFRHILSGQPMFARVHNWSIDNTTTIQLSDQILLKNIIGYRKIKLHSMEDYDGTSALFFPTERRFTQNQISEELQLQADFDRFNLIVGGFFFRERADDRAYSTGGLVVPGSQNLDPGDLEPSSLFAYGDRYSVTWLQPVNKSYAAFAQGSYKITDTLSVTAGIRGTWDTRRSVILNRAYQPAISVDGLSCRFTLDQDNNPATPETRPSLDQCRFEDKASFSEPTYTFSLEYRPNPDLMLYAATRHGYRSGGFGSRGTSQVTLSDTYDPETVDDIEFGIKSDVRFSGMFLRTNLAVYYAKYDGAQRILVSGLAPPISVLTNAGKARIQGSELEVLFRPNDLLELSGFYSYTDAKFTRFIDPNGNDLSPQVYPRTPKHVVNLRAQLNLPVPSGVGSAFLAANYVYQSSMDVSDDYQLERAADGSPLPNGVAYNRAQIIPAYTLVNFSAGWRNVMGSNLDLSAFLDNAFNEKYLMAHLSIGGAIETRTPGAPRTFGIRGTYRF